MHPFSMKDLTSMESLSSADVLQIFEATARLKSERAEKGHNRPYLEGKILGMIFEKASLRTRVSFESGMLQLGGHAIYLDQGNFKLGERESIYDVAKNMERFVDILMLRTFSHQAILDMAAYTSIPIINGLSDNEHPCQALADLFTIFEHRKTLIGQKLVFIGDGNNVATSLAYAAALTGMHFVCVSPEGYMLKDEVLEKARAASVLGAVIERTSDIRAAAADADCLYTDVWASMGQEKEREARAAAFKGYQLNDEILALAKPDALVEHCLPAHRGEEITDSVMDSAHSVVFDEAENRMHVQKAIMALLLGKL
jgi:ornithine carbamoyltransferase